MKLPENVRIVPAGPEQIPALLAGLSVGEQSPAQVDAYCALQDGNVWGGIGLQIRRERNRTAGSFQLTVVEGAPEGTAELLVQAAKVLARKQGALVLRYYAPVAESSSLASLLDRCHFSRTGEAISTFQVRLDHPKWERFARTTERLKQTGRIPDDTSLVPLNRVASMAASDLVTSTIGGPGPELMQELLNPETISRAAVRGATLEGLLVATIRESDVYISLMAIPPGQRNSWSYAMLGLEVYREVRKHPEIRTWTFKTNPGIHKAIRNFAHTMEAEHLGDEYSWEFSLEL